MKSQGSTLELPLKLPVLRSREEWNSECRGEIVIFGGTPVAKALAGSIPTLRCESVGASKLDTLVVHKR